MIGKTENIPTEHAVRISSLISEQTASHFALLRVCVLKKSRQMVGTHIFIYKWPKYQKKKKKKKKKKIKKTIFSHKIIESNFYQIVLQYKCLNKIRILVITPFSKLN